MQPKCMPWRTISKERFPQRRTAAQGGHLPKSWAACCPWHIDSNRSLDILPSHPPTLVLKVGRVLAAFWHSSICGHLLRQGVGCPPVLEMVILQLGEGVPADANVSKEPEAKKQEKPEEPEEPEPKEPEEKEEPEEPEPEACEEEAERDENCSEECAICFESGNFVDLPCACSIKYCGSCWDRALAASVTVRGKAQCPSCRAAFNVDFDTDRGLLVFSKDPDGTGACDWRIQLYEKVRGVQIKLLQGYGIAALGQSPSSFPSSLSSPSSPSSPSCKSGIAPHCVCGAELEYITSRARIIRLLEDMDPNWRSRDTYDMVERLLESSLVTCDLCEKVAIRSKGLWTCKNGPHTVMHPAAYDVCEACFEKYSGVSSLQFSDDKQSTTRFGWCCSEADLEETCASMILDRGRPKLGPCCAGKALESDRPVARPALLCWGFYEAVLEATSQFEQTWCWTPVAESIIV
eukprot:s2477_g7.t1